MIHSINTNQNSVYTILIRRRLFIIQTQYIHCESFTHELKKMELIRIMKFSMLSVTAGVTKAPSASVAPGMRIYCWEASLHICALFSSLYHSTVHLRMRVVAC